MDPSKLLKPYIRFFFFSFEFAIDVWMLDFVLYVFSEEVVSTTKDIVVWTSYTPRGAVIRGLGFKLSTSRVTAELYLAALFY